MCNDKIQVALFVFDSGRKITICVKFEDVVFVFSDSNGYINEIQLTTCELLIEKTSFIYLNIRLKAIASAFYFLHVFILLTTALSSG
jgi:hypothetical protein